MAPIISTLVTPQQCFLAGVYPPRMTRQDLLCQHGDILQSQVDALSSQWMNRVGGICHQGYTRLHIIHRVTLAQGKSRARRAGQYLTQAVLTGTPQLTTKCPIVKRQQFLSQAVLHRPNYGAEMPV
jgi:hypothetical protein